MLTRRKKKTKDENPKGIALIIVILALSIMLLMALVVSTTSTTEVAISGSSAREASAHYLAESGLNQALAMVRNIQNGDLNDLLAGPDGQCAAPCTSAATAWATAPATSHPLSTHGNELVVDTSVTAAVPKWSSTANGQLLVHSLQPTPMFAPGVRGFMPANNTVAVVDGGDGLPPMYITCPSGDYVNCPGTGGYAALNWAGKQEYYDDVTRTKYVTLLEVYDDDDPLSLEYNAFNGSNATYPNGFVVSANTPNSKVYGATPVANSNTNTLCDLDGTAPFECAGKNPGRSFSNVNMDFNNRIVIRSTGRVLKQFGTGAATQWRILSESSVDAIVGFLPYPAVLTGNCLALNGSSSVTGAYGSVFSNANICVGGGGVNVSQVAGAAGTICGNTGASSQVSGQPKLFIPDFKPIPDKNTAPYDDGPQAAPYANPALDLTVAGGNIPLQYSSSGTGQRVYPGDYWLRQAAALTSSTPAGLNPTAGLKAGGYILVQAHGKAGSRRTCIDGTVGCENTAEDGILSRLGITEKDLEAVDIRVARAPGSGGNSDAGFDHYGPLIIRLVLKTDVSFPTGGGASTVKMDVIDRDKIFVASLGGSNPSTKSSSAGGPKKIGSDDTFEFYRVVPGAAALALNNANLASFLGGVGETLSSYNAGGSSNQSVNSGPSSYGDTAHGWSVDGGVAGSCGTTPGSGCSGGCSNCPAYPTVSCSKPYGGTWDIDERDDYARGYTYFVDGNLSLTGVGNATPFNATLIMTGHITLRGNNGFTPVMRAKLSPLQPPFTNPVVQFLVGSDLDFGGNVADGVTFDGLAYAREQIAGTGSGTYNGQMVAADKASKDAIVLTNSLGGNYTVSFNRAANVLGTLNVTSWRKLKF